MIGTLTPILFKPCAKVLSKWKLCQEDLSAEPLDKIAGDVVKGGRIEEARRDAMDLDGIDMPFRVDEGCSTSSKRPAPSGTTAISTMVVPSGEIPSSRDRSRKIEPGMEYPIRRSWSYRSRPWRYRAYRCVYAGRGGGREGGGGEVVRLHTFDVQVGVNVQMLSSLPLHRR